MCASVQVVNVLFRLSCLAFLIHFLRNFFFLHCSKTSLARALAGTASCSFFTLSAANVFSPYVGDSERCIRDAFERARRNSPAVLFLDELDAIAGAARTAGSGVSSLHLGQVDQAITRESQTRVYALPCHYSAPPSLFHCVCV